MPAPIITNPQFSFVRFGDSQAPIIPVALNTDVKFQLVAEFPTMAATNAVMASNVYMMLVKNNAVINTSGDLPANLIFDYSQPGYGIEVDKIRIADHKILLYWPHGMPDVETLAEGTCFRLVLQIGDGVDDEYFFLSNSFTKVDTDYSSAIEYYCDEDSYGFIYCPGDIVNKIRVPMYLLKPQFTDDESVYVDSKGKRFVTKSVTSKVYEVLTDHMTEDLHEKLKVAIGHDEIEVACDTYTGGISKNGPYDIGWPEVTGIPDKGQAKFRVFASPYLLRNDNCQACNLYEPCVPAAFDGEFALPDVLAGDEYNYSIELTGTAPFVLNIVSKPAWMTISLDGSTLTFSGTAGDPAVDVAVEFNITNCEATGTLNGTDTFDITEEPPVCDTLAPVGSTVLPDANEDEPYLFEIEFTGTTPISLSGIVKPSWMTIEVIAPNIVRFSGTPTSGDVADGVSVEVTVENCDAENPFVLDQTIDVSALPPTCTSYEITATSALFECTYTTCAGDPITLNLDEDQQETVCAQTGSVEIVSGTGLVLDLGPC